MQINNVRSVFARGYQVLYGAIISGCRDLHVNGSNSLTQSQITTKLRITNDTNLNSKVRLYIDGTNSDTYNITCSNDDKCIIDCLSSTSCTNMFLTCNCICYLNCGNYSDSLGNDCPSTIYGTWYPLTPTSNPTIIPSVSPSDLPLMIPTNLPSVTTLNPTRNPSISPTNLTTITSHTLHGQSSTLNTANTADVNYNNQNRTGENTNSNSNNTLSIVIIILVVIFFVLIIIII